MAAEEDITSRLAEARRKLLAEGARSFVAANTALIEFRREVVTRSRDVLEAQLTAYSDAIGVALKREGIVEWSGPPDTDWTGKSAGLGVRIAGVQASPTEDKLLLWLYCGLYWDDQGSQSPWFGSYIGVGFNRQKFADALNDAFCKIALPGVGQEKNDVWMCEKLALEAAVDLHEQLGQRLGVWIDAWKRVGGLTGIMT